MDLKKNSFLKILRNKEKYAYMPSAGNAKIIVFFWRQWKWKQNFQAE